MDELKRRILTEGQGLAGGILKVDSFLNHQLDPELTMSIGREFHKAFQEQGAKTASKIVTAEVSGIAPALATGLFYKVPVVFARKKLPITMSGKTYSTKIIRPTKKDLSDLIISSQYLNQSDKVILIDDFLSTGKTLQSLINLVREAGATLLGVGCVIEKVFEGGRERLKDLDIPVISLARITAINAGKIELGT